MPRIKKIKEESNADRLARYDRIIQAYEYAGLPTTQKEIGATLKPKVGQGAVSAWKRVNPSIGHLAQICRLTGVCGHWLLLGEGPIWAADAQGNVASLMQSLVDQLPDDARAEVLARIQGKRATG